MSFRTPDQFRELARRILTGEHQGPRTISVSILTADGRVLPLVCSAVQWEMIPLDDETEADRWERRMRASAGSPVLDDLGPPHQLHVALVDATAVLPAVSGSNRAPGIPEVGLVYQHAAPARDNLRTSVGVYEDEYFRAAVAAEARCARPDHDHSTSACLAAPAGWVDDPEFGVLPTAAAVNTRVDAHPQTQRINEEFGWEYDEDADERVPDAR
jgi:hypothetical protein